MWILYTVLNKDKLNIVPHAVNRTEMVLTVHIGVHVLCLSSCAGPLDLWFDYKRALFPGEVNLMLHRETMGSHSVNKRAEGKKLNSLHRNKGLNELCWGGFQYLKSADKD